MFWVLIAMLQPQFYGVLILFAWLWAHTSRLDKKKPKPTRPPARATLTPRRVGRDETRSSYQRGSIPWDGYVWRHDDLGDRDWHGQCDVDNALDGPHGDDRAEGPGGQQAWAT